jgi:radical SAM protein with 4Fe4S-binding SPASM domain
MNEKQDIRPRLIAFEITRRCKLNCKHCRANSTSEEPDFELTTEQAKKIIDSIADYKKSIIIFTGGEPLERSDIYELTKHASRQGCPAVMATCGYPINPTSAQKLKNAGVISISLSLDAPDAETHDDFRGVHGAFEYAITAAEHLKKNGIRFQINTTITKNNIHLVEQIAELAQKLGAYCFNPFILVPTGRAGNLKNQIVTPTEYRRLLEKFYEIKTISPLEVRVTCGPQFARLCQVKGKNAGFKSSGCIGGRGFGFISYKGDVQTCGFLDLSAGNLLENNFNFDHIWENSKLLNEIRNTSLYTGKCGQCKFIDTCRGCRARAYYINGSYLAEDPVCDI